MGRDLQKKKNRSGKQPVKIKPRKKRILNPLGNSIIAKNWNKKETLSQNYRRLGLVSRLKAPTGGTELSLAEATLLREASLSTTSSIIPAAPPKKPKTTPLAIASTESAVIRETKVERDASGKIIRVIGSSAKRNPLRDPLNEFDDDSEEEEEEDEEEEAEEWGGIQDTEDDKNKTGIVRQLEELAARPVIKKPRHQSEREREWIGRLVEKYGEENTAAMARDRRLNPMQQTEADIRKRLRIWQENR
ncbi:hypothetical protein jhhlp_006613 [Lomentospora prolificans]|uniref:Nucleolar protein 16 n=1 Tax=Lomentospora prolificans TaxID=41688 RepID=A0A2N3N6D8_9PEZI|nr:hypothetical protein jhhlp_006613 [Lomentospora prolificans]